MQLTGANLKRILIAVNPFSATLRHGPPFIAWTVNGHIERTIIVCIGSRLAICPRVIGGEYTSHESDDTEAMLTIVA